jgi:hypothetical protein
MKNQRCDSRFLHRVVAPRRQGLLVRDLNEADIVPRPPQGFDDCLNIAGNAKLGTPANSTLCARASSESAGTAKLALTVSRNLGGLTSFIA